MAVPVHTTEQFDQWMEDLSPRERKEAFHAWRLLGELGLQLDYPHSSAIKGSRFPLRELRPKRGKSPLRIIYAFDPRREALLLIGGNKASNKKMYDSIIPQAEAIWEQHLKDVSEEET